MYMLIFDFKTKTAGVVGSPATLRAYADAVAAQQQHVSTASANVAPPKASR
jgi:hypothetical protein